MISMATIKLNRAMREAEKFLDIAHRYLDSKKTVSLSVPPEEVFEYDVYSKKLSGSLKRQSMELTNALIEYRKPN